MNRALLQQALEVLDSYDAEEFRKGADLIAAIKSELAKPEPEPVGYVYTHNGLAQGALTNKAMIAGTPLYAAPDLLETLDELLGTLLQCFPDAPIDSVMGKNIINARAVIAKATGETP